jgi:hypothetical protein
MTTVLIIEKSGNIKELNIKGYSQAELYKKAGFKSEEDFKSIYTWNVSLEEKKYNVSLYGKTTGKANNENKYDFPPPVDTELFFGNCVLVNTDEENKCISLTENEWEKIYEFLFGGFDDLDEDEEEETEDDFDDLPVTKTGGYLKDDFVVDEDEEEEEEDEEEDEDEDEDEIIIKKPVKKSKKDIKTIIKKEVIAEPESYLDCQTELSEESYFSE